jgi:hypothetical protein
VPEWKKVLLTEANFDLGNGPKIETNFCSKGHECIPEIRITIEEPAVAGNVTALNRRRPIDGMLRKARMEIVNSISLHIYIDVMQNLAWSF